MRARKADEVLTAARRVILERGFDAATIDEVAAQAHVSKATVYSNFHDKDALLAAMIDRVTAESAAILEATIRPLVASGPVAERLSRVGVALAHGVLRPEVISMRRLAISTAVQFPESARQYFERGPRAAIAMLAEGMARMDAAGEIACSDPEGTAESFAYLVVGPLQDRLMFDPGHRPTPHAVAEQVDRAVALTLAGLAIDV